MKENCLNQMKKKAPLLKVELKEGDHWSSEDNGMTLLHYMNIWMVSQLGSGRPWVLERKL